MTTFVGRRRHDPFNVGVCVKLPAALVAAIDSYADDDFCRRSTAIRLLLERGLEAVGRPLIAEGK